MFEKSEAELRELGAHITTAEVKQQPELWRDTLEIYKANLEHPRDLQDQPRRDHRVSR